MTIITPGDLNYMKRDRTFDCPYCNARFSAAFGEYFLPDYAEIANGNIAAICQCPVCENMAYTYGKI